MNHLVSVLKSDGTRQLFEEDKLIHSLKRVGADDQALQEITAQVEGEMHDGMSTTQIYSRAFELLKKHSHHAAIKYSMKRAVFELGPDGFPFEKYVARIFNAWGYDAITDQILLGGCVDHEVDVVAWKGKELAMVEAKFHNEFGQKSDLKVVLYVKARCDDLTDVTFKFGDVERRLSEKWLITNTKFTDKAIAYGECKRMKLMSWNYPHQNNLHDIIEKYALHPITSLTSITNQQKRDLIGRGALICSDLAKQPHLLHDIGFSDFAAQNILKEALTVSRLSK